MRKNIKHTKMTLDFSKLRFYTCLHYYVFTYTSIYVFIMQKNDDWCFYLSEIVTIISCRNRHMPYTKYKYEYSIYNVHEWMGWSFLFLAEMNGIKKNINRLDTLNLDYRLYPIRMDYAKMKLRHVWASGKCTYGNLSSIQTK